MWWSILSSEKKVLGQKHKKKKKKKQAYTRKSWPVCDRGYSIKILVVFVVFFMWWLNCCNFLNFTSGCCYRHTGRWQAETRGISSSWIGCCSHRFFSRKFNLPVGPNQVNKFICFTYSKQRKTFFNITFPGSSPKSVELYTS